MSLFGTLLKTGIAKKVFDEARKPHNQQKAKELFQNLTGKGKGGGSAPGGGAGGTTPR